RFLRPRAFDGVAHHHPAALVTGHGTSDHDQSAFDVDLCDLDVLGRHIVDAVVAMHLLVLESFTGILAAACAAERAVRDRYAVAPLEAAEIPPLHRAGEAATDGDAGHVDFLSGDEVIGLDEVADVEEILLVDAELGELALGLDLRFGKLAAFG